MQYDPKDVLFTFGGIVVTGFGDGTFIEVKNQNAAWTMKVGADGYGVFSKSNDYSATTIVRLMPGALANQLLSVKLTMDRFGNVGFGPLSITDAASGDTHFAPKTRIMKAPDKMYAKEVEVLEWEFGSLDMLSNYGAGGALSPLI